MKNGPTTYHSIARHYIYSRCTKNLNVKAKRSACRKHMWKYVSCQEQMYQMYVRKQDNMGVYKLKMLLFVQRLLKMHLKYSTHTRPGYYLKCTFFRNNFPGSESEKPCQFVSNNVRKAFTPILALNLMFRWSGCLNLLRSVRIFWTVFGLLADQCPDDLEIVRKI